MKQSGEIVLIDPGSDAQVRMPTLQCVHCGGHWVPRPGSGKTRGYCPRCNGYVCGPSCEKCVPQERMIENIEQGKSLDHRPIVVAPGYGE